ncbi:hypothetical protein HY379_01020 [Candidatus Saccharibacteria bacterium]|nr:hypothetical protein [Candidatus Saccharibacteria bacterium]
MGLRPDFEDFVDRLEEDFLSEERIRRVGLTALEFEDSSVIQNALGLVREIADPDKKVEAINSVIASLEAEKARTILDSTE